MEPRTVVTNGPDLSNPARVGAGRTSGPARAWAGFVLVLAARAYRAFLLTLVVAALAPMLWSWSTYVVKSGSMTPALSIGDVVVGKPLAAGDPIPTGRVMVFHDPARDRILIHRVAERLGDGTFISAGDANKATDSTPVPRKNFIDRAVICVPFVGLPLVWLENRELIPLLGWSLLTALVLLLAWRRPGEPRHRRRSDRKPADGAKTSKGPARLGRVVALVAGVGVVAGSAMLMPVEGANAAFVARTTNSGSTWKVAVNSSKATSNIQVYDTPAASGWYLRGSVSVNVYATAAVGSSVRSITYRVNGGTPVTINSASLVFTLATQGDNTITYFATDNNGGAESVHTTHIKLDNQVPTLTVTSQVGDMTHAQWRATCPRPGGTGGVCGATGDGSGSGVATVAYILSRSSDQRCFDGSKWTGAACTKRTSATVGSGSWYAAVPDGLLEVPRVWYTITVFVTDAAGNEYNTTRNFSVG